MAALHDPAIDPSRDPEASIVDFASARAARRAGAQPADGSAAAPGGIGTVVAFPVEFARTPRLRAEAVPSTDASGFDARQACEQLVQRFRVMHEAMIELIVTCQEFKGSTDLDAGETSELMVNLAMLSMSTERFHDELTATVDGAFG